MVLDGEIAAFGADGRPSFAALQERVQLKTEREIAQADREAPVVFFCFDLLHFAGIDVRPAPYADRRRWLEQCLLPSPHVQLVHAEEDGEELYKAALASGFEGVIAKRKDSKYEAGKRSPAWLKIKPTRSAEFVVGGGTTGKGSRAQLGALLLGYSDEGKLRYCGDVGSGVDESTLTHLHRVYWAADAALKQPAITKRDLLRYFAQVSPFMLTHLADRPLTMIRMPEGIAGERFFQKHWDPELPAFAKKITIFSEHKDERHDYLLCDNLATLLWLAPARTLALS